MRTLAFLFIACAGAIVYFSSAWLPDPVAGNFGAGGRPTGFTHRDTYRAYMSTLTSAVPLLVYGGIVWLPRTIRRPPWPRFGEARRPLPLVDSERLGLFISCVVGLFWILMHAVVVRANSFSPPHFEAGLLWLLLLAWLAFIGLVLVVYVRRTSRVL